ncbi:unnamed protein product [Ceutorhynchus assimilis]|uniref:Uncharacterized protein n=1 Tax=Ceutorhynchus assimilis TaxID=467358 RepID=A0A9N9M9A4_9CUCU|nr:unnamed protein product [Ceutorhynchus assimilis]
MTMELETESSVWALLSWLSNILSKRHPNAVLVHFSRCFIFSSFAFVERLRPRYEEGRLFHRRTRACWLFREVKLQLIFQSFIGNLCMKNCVYDLRRAVCKLKYLNISEIVKINMGQNKSFPKNLKSSTP